MAVWLIAKGFNPRAVASAPAIATAPQSSPRGQRRGTVTAKPQRPASLQPRWFIRSFWAVQRGVYSVTRGRFGLQTATADRQGMMRLRTVGRRTGQERVAILGYFEDGPDLVTMAMNGWADPEPAWWLNLQAQPDVTVDLPGGSRSVHGRAASQDERPRLWARWAAFDRMWISTPSPPAVHGRPRS